MTYIHHIQVDARSIQRLKRFLETYEQEHPNSIIGHAPGYLGKNYLVRANVDLREALRSSGFESLTYALN